MTETRKCQMCGEGFVIDEQDFEFYADMKVPPPTFCPSCRLQRRLSYKNERTLYKRQCDLCKENSISVFPEGTTFPVYCAKCWWSDAWSADEYAVDYNLNEHFFTQFFRLRDRVPKIGLYYDAARTVNSSYINLGGPVKDCYLVFLVEDSEACMYSSSVFYSKEIVDSTKVSNLTKGYGLYNCQNSYNLFYCVGCKDSVLCYFSKNLRNCQNCFGCVNLTNKNYCFFNEQYTEDEYKKKISEINFGSRIVVEEYKKKTKDFFLKFPVKFYHGLSNTDVSGDYIYNSKNVKDSFEVMGGEDNRYCYVVNMPTSDHCYDYGDWGNGVSHMYESVNCGEQMHRIRFSYGSWIGMDQDYCDVTYASNYMFGCISMKNKQYCILNKQYTKEEYEKLRGEIIRSMNEHPYVDKEGRIYTYGEFFPSELSHFSYNETVAQEYFPLSKDEAMQKGFRWHDKEVREYKHAKDPLSLPDDIRDITDSIVGEIIQCAHKGQCTHECLGAFRITTQELLFYRDMHIPVPVFCHNCRHHERLENRNPLMLWTRTCMCNSPMHEYKNTSLHPHGAHACKNVFKTSFSPDRKELVYCEECYREEVS